MTYAPRSRDRKLIGYFATLEDAVRAVHAYEYEHLEPHRLVTGPATVRQRPEMPGWKRPPGAVK
ncbi:hypothetical protein GCM10027267_11270 [Paramicrobacterium agarici]